MTESPSVATQVSEHAHDLQGSPKSTSSKKVGSVAVAILFTGLVAIRSFYYSPNAAQLSLSLASKSEHGGCAELDGGGWKRVRHVPASQGTWHKATDHLEGTDVYGDPSKDDAEWSLRFDQIAFKQFLFATGDCTKWLIAPTTSVFGEYANADRAIIKSSSSPSSGYTAKWYNRASLIEDPWISLNDHADAISQGTILYGGNHFGGDHAKSVRENDGADVYIRQTAHFLATPSSMTCGPLFGHSKCNPGPSRWSALYCNEETGQCGNTPADRDAQASTKYDASHIDMPVKCHQLQHSTKEWEEGKQAGAFYYKGHQGSQYRFKPVCLLSFGKMHERKVRYMCGDCSEVSCCPNKLGQNDQTWTTLTTTTDANTCQVKDQRGEYRKCYAADTNIDMRELSYKAEEQCIPTYMGSTDIQEKCGDARPPPPPDCTDTQRWAGCASLIHKWGKDMVCTPGFVGCPCDCK